MKIITISREFGSGGRELGRRLAGVLGFDYYDKEIIAAICQARGLNEDYVETALENHAWQSIPITFRNSFGAASVMGSPQIALLLEQKKVIERIAQAGRDSVIVGRNADVILKSRRPFRVFVCARTEAKIRRCVERAGDGVTLSRRQIELNMRRIDKNRAKTWELISGESWGSPVNYDITVNTTEWEPKALAPAVAECAMRCFGGMNENPVV